MAEPNDCFYVPSPQGQSVDSGGDPLPPPTTTEVGTPPSSPFEKRQPALQDIKQRRAYYKRWSDVWWNAYLFFLVGGSFAAAFGSAFNFVQETNHVLWGTIALIGGVSASITSALTPDKKADWERKAFDHLDSAIISYENGLIDIRALVAALQKAADLASGRA